MLTKTQKNFKKRMKQIERKYKNKEKFYSYIHDRYISSYYERSKENRSIIRWLNIAKYFFIVVALIFGSIFYFFAPYSNITAIPFTLMIISIILLLFGLIHPSLAFFDGRSRIRVVIVYGFSIFVWFFVCAITLLQYTIKS
jgi:O-antigen/teichoic acid export membrane protein